MKFVVKGTTPGRDVVWLSPPGPEGFRGIGRRMEAAEFPTRSDARLAIAGLPRLYNDAGFFFWVTVEPTDADKKRLLEITMTALGETRASEAVQFAIRQNIELL
jgi:hypothetical protein